MTLMIRLLLLVALCFVNSAHAAPMERGRAEMWCGKFFNGDRWHVSRDDDVQRWAAEFLAKAHIRATPVVCIGAPDSSDSAASQMLSDGFDEYFFVGLNADFRIAIGDELRAVVAHEVAHLVTNRGVHCNDRGGLSGYEACEHDADAQADLWAGKGSMARALRFTIQYFEAKSGGDVQTIELVRSVRRRIFLLR